MGRFLRLMIFAALLLPVATCAGNRAFQPGYVDHNNDRHYWEE